MTIQYISTLDEKKKFLDQRVHEYNRSGFIVNDPISIPHGFSMKEDREISGYLAATLAWGNRTQIIRNASKLINLMENAPYQFLCEASEKEYARFLTFIHRTFNGEDCLFILQALRNLYRDEGGMESAFLEGYRRSGTILESIHTFRQKMLQTAHISRSEKHISNPLKGSAAKRINMFLRWMVRRDDQGVDFGIWTGISPSSLMCPLDLHSGRIARLLGLLSRGQDDWKAVEELTNNLRLFDEQDPVRYDFALFGIGIHEKTSKWKK